MSATCSLKIKILIQDMYPLKIVIFFVIHGRVLKITSYLGTDSGSRLPKPDEVKMVLYSRGMWNALFSLAVY